MVYSDPTYEAWKRNEFALFVVGELEHSDPTYEAWKLLSFMIYFALLLLIPILPMRHGNPVKTSLGNIKDKIPILPMRHGNINPASLKEPDPLIPILPMRHGNPLSHHSQVASLPHSDPTYEAWKRKKISHMLKAVALIPILPMRHGNMKMRNWQRIEVRGFRSYL